MENENNLDNRFIKENRTIFYRQKKTEGSEEPSVASFIVTN